MIPKTLVHDTGSAKYILFEGNDYISLHIKRDGVFEGNILATAAGILNRFESGLTLDIGANMGTYSIPLAQQFPKFSFVSFEPQKTIYYQLCGNITLNSLGNITAYNIGLGEESKTLEVAIPDYSTEINIGGFHLINNNEGDKEKMRIEPLDAFELENVRLIKIDVEGMEINVLRGALDTLRNSNYPAIIFESFDLPEYASAREELFGFLKELGYLITTIDNTNTNFLAEKK
jgi:FkbM family methyltransferase